MSKRKNKGKKDSRFYVYEWFNVESGEVFYVGKGCGYRYKSIEGRNNYFLNYYNKYKCDVRKIKENLTEQEAFDNEIIKIKEYKSKGQYKCNLSSGGEGCTYEKDTRNYIIQKLTALYNLRGAMDDMPNEAEYEPKNLKHKTYDELINMYYDYYNFKQDFDTYMDSGIEEELTYQEFNMKSHETKMLIDIMLKDYSSKNHEYKKLFRLKNKNKIILESYNVDFDKMLNDILSEYDFFREILYNVFYTLKYIKSLAQIPSFPIKIKSFVFKDGKLHIKLRTLEIQKDFRQELELQNIIGDLIINKDFTLADSLVYNINIAEIIQ